MSKKDRDQNDLLSTARVGILGLGLMGGSLALGLHGKCRQLIGVDPDPEALLLAESRGACDRLAARPETVLPACDVVILAAPVRTIMRLLGNLPRVHPGNPIVFDLGSSKVEILGAMQSLPVRFDPLGGHPMCGKENSGMAAADPEIFRQRPFVFTRLERTSVRACHVAEQIALAVGAVPRWMDAETHDRWVSATSHLPYLAACALARSTPLEVAPLAGPGFTSTTRVAGTPSSVMLDVLFTNRSNLLDGLKELRRQLDLLENSLDKQDTGALELLLDAARERREKLLQPPAEEVLR